MQAAALETAAAAAALAATAAALVAVAVAAVAVDVDVAAVEPVPAAACALPVPSAKALFSANLNVAQMLLPWSAWQSRKVAQHQVMASTPVCHQRTEWHRDGCQAL